MLLQGTRNEDGRRMLNKESRELVEELLTEELMRLARLVRATSALPMLMADTLRLPD